MIRATRAIPLLCKALFCLSLLCIRSTAYPQQTHEPVTCKPVSQKTGDTGCWILAHQPLGTPAGPIYWTLDTFPTKELAEQAKGPQGTVVESLGKVWLFTIGEKPKLHPSGTRVTEIGPLSVEKGRSYIAQYMEANLQPGMVSETHLHSGIEAFYTDSGETCLETPNGMQIGRKGANVVIPEGVPMELTAVGTEVRHGLVLILHDSTRPPTTLVESWKSKHLCAKAN